MDALLINHRVAIEQLCALNKVKELYVFGSAAINKMQAESDIDLVVSFRDDLSPLEHGACFLNLKDNLEALLKKEIDLLSYRAIRNPILKDEIDLHKTLLYAA
ncbi:MAG: nucleotidyltransferase domain-containing protein [Sphingobacteriaceae bacterium]|nr:nucleotidyltransferase domain-containing protein [Sphingobacteriaceae bacterium]